METITMYQRDCTIISKHSISSPDGLYDTIEFTLCTINMPLSRVHTQRVSIKQEGIHSKWVSDTKAKGILYAQQHKQEEADSAAYLECAGPCNPGTTQR